MKRVEYAYRGKNYTVAELSKLSGLSMTVIHNRLKSDWTVEKAVETPYDGTPPIAIEKRWQGKKLEIIFRRPVSGVFPHMQPTLEKPYAAIPCIHSTGKSGGCKQNFIITLENGKPLFVYPGEFEIIGEVEE